MKAIDFYFDPISPYAYLAFERLPMALMGHSVVLRYKPILFAGLLKVWGQKGPAEIEPKRAWTYRQVVWLAQQQGTCLELPAQHPFNPLPLLRLAYACAQPGDYPSRYVCEMLFKHVWQGGLDAGDADRLRALTTLLQPLQDPSNPNVKQRLQEETQMAVQEAVFGVPTALVDGKSFFGQDGLQMLSAYLNGDAWFADEAWNQLGALVPGVRRRD